MDKKKIIKYIIIFIILITILWIIIEEYKERKIRKQETKLSKYEIQEISTNYNNFTNETIEKEEKNTKNKKNEENEKINENNNQKEQIIKEYRGYDVLAKLEIPNINLETYILKTYSTAALNISVTKFWGANPNEIGNFCVAGHNFVNKNMFHNLKNLKIGNHFFISDNTNGKIEYEIYDIYTVFPNDVSCLSQETEGIKIVTLITCTNDSKKRIIVKAQEVNNEK